MIGPRALLVAGSAALLPLPLAAQDDHSAHGATAPDSAEIGNAPPPPIPQDHPADQYFAPERMAAARRELAHMGHFSTTVMQVDMLEYRVVSGTDGYAWSGELWTGNDYDRFVLASEGEGAFDEAPEQAELQAKWRHALDPFFNLELGLRQDFRPDPSRTYAMIGIAGDAPYWLDVEGHLFVSNKGDAHVRLEASHDWRLTQRVIVQPAAEVNFAFQNVPELDIGSGFERIELGARLRYQVVPEFAPYVGVHWEQRLGRTADLARLHGEHASSVAAVFGISTWF
jgi:copper resistance protein B